MIRILRQAQQQPRRSRLVALTVVATILVTGGAASASAYWTATATVGSTVAPSAISLTVTNASALATEWKFGVAASSPVVAKQLTITNTGGTPLAYSLGISNTSSSLATNTRLWLWTQAGCTTPAGTPGTLAAPPVLPAGTTTAAAGAAITLCAATQLLTTVAASQGQSNTATFTVTGTIGTNWTTSNPVTVGGQAIQSVYRIPPMNAVTCANNLIPGLTGVNLSWTAVTGATGYTITGNGTQSLITTVSASTTTVTLNKSLGTPVWGATQVTITADDATYGTTNTAKVQTITQQTLSIVCP